jgi:voltage-gated potassium channel
MAKSSAEAIFRLRGSVPRGPDGATASRMWRWATVLALSITTPAFYAELISPVPPAWAAAVYIVAAAILASAAVHGRRQLSPVRAVLDALLVVGLLAAALVPPSSVSQAALVLRLAVAFLTLSTILLRVQHWITRGGVVNLMLLAFGVLLTCGAGYWWLEPRTPSLAEGMWLAFTTAATVGYGDIVPSTPASRIFSVFVVLLGYGVLTLVTAAIATTWIETEERRIEREILRDLHRRLGALREEIATLRTELQSRGDPPPA